MFSQADAANYSGYATTRSKRDAQSTALDSEEDVIDGIDAHVNALGDGDFEVDAASIPQSKDSVYKLTFKGLSHVTGVSKFISIQTHDVLIFSLLEDIEEEANFY